ncbi:hypothetical protein HDU67_000997 [Dinochytrium kinnereticum]|nr:hypothetical protein HDU67_000997 [Dinochytrium kinnereticum]
MEVSFDDFKRSDFNLKSWINKALSEANIENAATGVDLIPSSASPSVAGSIMNATSAPILDSSGFSDSLEVGIPSVIEDSDSLGEDSGRFSTGSSTHHASSSIGTVSPKPAASSAVSSANRNVAVSPLDIHASTIEHRLHLYSQELSARLDQLAEDAVKSVPRLLHDIVAISRDASSLAFLVSAVRKELDKGIPGSALTLKGTPSLNLPTSTLRASTTDAFEALQQLDNVRTRMEMTRQRLKETENWSTLTTELDAIFASGDLDRAGQRLLEASRSLQLLEGTPEQEERKALLGKLRNRLEMDLGPRLVAAIQSRDLEAARKCWTLFEQIGRKAEFESCYYRTRRAPVVKKWIEGTERLASRSPGDALGRFTEFLASFYDELLQMLKAEIDLVTLEPSEDVEGTQKTAGLAKGTRQGSRQSQARFLPVLIKSYITTVEWCREVERDILAALPTITPVIPLRTGSTVTSTIKKRVSGIPSGTGADGAGLIAQEGFPVSNGEEAFLAPSGISRSTSSTVGMTPVDPSWGQPIFDAFLTFQQSYGALESAHLSRCLPGALRAIEILQTTTRAGTLPPAAGSTSRSSSFLNDAVRSLAESVPKVFAHAESALLRCLDLTAGFGFPGLIEALNAYISDALDSFASAIFQIRDEMGLEDEGLSIASLFGNATPLSIRRRQPSTGNANKAIGEDSTQSEWMTFQVGLRVLAVSRTLSYRLKVLESGMLKALLRVKPMILSTMGTSYSGGSDESGEKDQFQPDLDEAALAIASSDTDLFVKDSTMDLSSISSPRLESSLSDISLSGEVWRVPCVAALSALQVSSLNNLRLHQLFASVAQSQSEKASTDNKASTTESKGSVKIPTDLPHLLLLSPLMPTLKSVTTSSQRLIFDSLFVPVDRQLATIPHLREWTTADSGAAGSLPRFSLSPLPYVTRVGEHLLTLPQRIEVHGGEDGVLGFSARSLPFLEEGDFQHMHLTVGEAQGEMTGKSDEQEESTKAAEVEAQEENEEEEDVMHLWITSLSRATVASYVSAILRINPLPTPSAGTTAQTGENAPSLGPEASRQLSTDVSYLTKVLEAMDVATPPALAIVSAIMEVPVPNSLLSKADRVHEEKEGVRAAMKASASSALESLGVKEETNYSGLIEKLIILRGFGPQKMP